VPGASRPAHVSFFGPMLRKAFTATALILLGACSQADEKGPQDPTIAESSSSSSSSASSGTGGSGGASGGTGGNLAACDNAGTCGDYTDGCTGCAISGLCAEHYDGCFGDESCLIFNKCLAGCKDDLACRDECAKSNPVGADRYGALVACIVCQVCPNSCAAIADFCP
jgi:hypothetical protein